MEERRKNNEEILNQLQIVADGLHAIKGKQIIIEQYLQVQFGGKDLVGTPTEGNVMRTLREINEKIRIQNGRVTKTEEKVKKLEDEKLTFAGICIGAGAAISWFFKLIWK